jgi:iron complex outermembrane receptor protein
MKFKKYIALVYSFSLAMPFGLYAEPSSSNDLTELRVTGALSELGLERLGKPVSIITHDQLQERSEPTIGELLASQPGVSSSYFGPSASRPVIRGQSRQRVRILENGLDSGDVSDVSDDHAVASDPISLQRIDILRGPSTLLYGSSAIGGVVNMIDQSIAEEPVGTPLTGEVDLRKGDSADEESTGAIALNGQAGSINWHFSSFYRETDDIEIPGYAESARLRASEEEASENDEKKGTLENSDSLSKGLKLGASHVWSDGFFGIAVRSNRSNYGIPGGHEHEEASEESAPAAIEEELPRIDLRQNRYESRGEFRLKDEFFKAVRFGLAYSNYEHKELEGDAVGTKFEKSSLEGRIELTHRHGDGLQGGWGIQVRSEDFKAIGDEAFLPPSVTDSAALFGVEDYRLSERLVWQLGGRVEHTQIDPSQLGDRNFNLVSASTGPVANLDAAGEFTSGLTFSYNERAPTSTELFANGAHVATQTYEIGDQALTKERAFGTELVLKKNRGQVTGSTGVFWQHYLDYINLSPTGEEIDGFSAYNYSESRARLWGFEAEIDLQVSKENPLGLHLYGQLDYVNGRDLSANDYLPRITPLRGKIGAKYLFSNASVYAESIFVAPQNKTASEELSTDSYQLVNIGGAYQLNSRSSSAVRWEIYGRGTNLTNEEARVHSSFLKDVAPLRGRAFLAGVKVSF